MQKEGFFKGLALVFTAILALTGLQGVQGQEPIRIGIVQYVDHEALNDANQGFVDRMMASDYGDRIEWDQQNATGNQSVLQSIVEKTARDNDYLFAIATPAAQVLAAVESEKPILIAAVTDPVAAGLAESMESPGRNVTGTSDLAPIEDQVDLLLNSFPDTQRVGMIYNSSEVNSQVQAEKAQEVLEGRGIEVEIATVTSTNDIAQNLTPLVSKVDAMFMVTDNTIDSAIVLVGDIAKEAGIPTIGSSDSVVLTNGLATLSNAYYDYGAQTADMLIRILDEGLDPADMPIELGKDFQLVVNEDYAKAIGVDPSQLTLGE